MKEVIQQAIENSGLFMFLTKIQANDALDIFLKIEQVNVQLLETYNENCTLKEQLLTINE
jgi:hypothetical protein